MKFVYILLGYSRKVISSRRKAKRISIFKEKASYQGLIIYQNIRAS